MILFLETFVLIDADVYSFLKSRTVGFCLPSKDNESFWNELNSFLSSLKKSVKQKIFQKVKHKNYNDISGLLFNLNF